MKRLDAISILTLILSIGTLVITAAGTGNIKAGNATSPSSPVVIDANGRETALLSDILGNGEVGVLPVGKEPDPPPSTPLSDCIDINTASESDLTKLKGIGPATAKKLVEYRNRAGKFKKKEELMKVKGIGPVKFSAIEPFTCL